MLSKCRSCGASIVWLFTAAGKKMPADAETVTPGDKEFEAAAGHVSHFATCPDGERHRRREEPAAEPQLSLLEDLDAAPPAFSSEASAEAFMTEERVVEFANTLRSYGISPADFKAIREAAGFRRPALEWDEATYHQVLALAVWTATCMQAAGKGLHVYLRQIGATEHQIRAAEASFEALMATRGRRAAA